MSTPNRSPGPNTPYMSNGHMLQRWISQHLLLAHDLIFSIPRKRWSHFFSIFPVTDLVYLVPGLALLSLLGSSGFSTASTSSSAFTSSPYSRFVISFDVPKIVLFTFANFHLSTCLLKLLSYSDIADSLSFSTCTARSLQRSGQLTLQPKQTAE